MIYIPQPAMALNSSDFGPRDHYRMEHNQLVSRGWHIETIVDLVDHVLTRGPLEALIVNAHGMASPDGVALGTGLHLGNVHHFGRLRDRIGRIYLCACQVADTEDGRMFCQAFAAVMAAAVIASEEPQVITTADREPSLTLDLGALAYGQVRENYIDDFEGTVWEFFPDRGRVRSRLSGG